jgi:translocation and assembly module TamA
LDLNLSWHSRCRAAVLPVSKVLFVLRGVALVALLCSICACASIPKQRYGIERLKFKGVKELDSNALRACLSTEQRDKVTLGLGALASPNCGEPPFDQDRWSARLFALPWTKWPIYDEAVFKLDLDRVERWYQARGYYGVRVLNVDFKPSEARSGEGCKDEDCTVEITVNVDEGEPIRIRKLSLDDDGGLPPELSEELLDKFNLEQGDIFDEALYDQARERVAEELRDEGYARAAVEGEVVINRGLLVADIKLKVTPGPLCYIGDVKIVSKGDVPEGPILSAALLKKGQLFRTSDIEDAQRSIYLLGAFSAVSVRGNLEDTQGAEIPVEIAVEPRRKSEVMLGFGLLAGSVSSGPQAAESVSVPQWDLHLLGSYENRNFFGNLRRFRIEERPRMLFLAPFPGVPDGSPRFGNTITADFSQPGLIDGRTNLFLETRWDNGPDPFLLFFRNDFGIALGLERGFWKQRLNARVAVHQEVMQVARRQPLEDYIRKLVDGGEPRFCDADFTPGDPGYEVPLDEPPAVTAANATLNRARCLNQRFLIPNSYRLFFLEQRLTLDLRDDPTRPRKGAYFRVTVHEAIRIWDPSWNAVRVLPEARGYAPLGLGIILAARFALGSFHVLDRSRKLDFQSKVLGAQPYRLRGGGANSVRGFGPGELGNGRAGGIRRWEASLELRVPLSKDFYIVTFGDMGDVYEGYDEQGNKDVRFRFDHLNTSVGGGLRYYTIIGPVRLDVAGRPKALAGRENDNYQMNLGFTKFRGAVHLTIGESF